MKNDLNIEFKRRFMTGAVDYYGDDIVMAECFIFDTEDEYKAFVTKYIDNIFPYQTIERNGKFYIRAALVDIGVE